MLPRITVRIKITLSATSAAFCLVVTFLTIGLPWQGRENDGEADDEREGDGEREREREHESNGEGEALDVRVTLIVEARVLLHALEFLTRNHGL